MSKLVTRSAAVGLIAALCCLPWVIPSLVWCGWLGIAAGLALVTRLPWLAGLACTASWSAMALGAAFYWAPRALSQTMQTGYGWGLAVFVPLLLWEAARATLPFWLAARVGAPAVSAWLPTALVAVVLEAVLPSVFPWRFGYMQIAWPATIQSIDLFGAEWATMMQFAHAGAILCLGAALLEAIRARRLAVLLKTVLRSAAIWLCAANLVYGMVAMSYWSRQVNRAASLRVALVQADPTYLGSADKLLRLTQTVAGKADLVCWPESSGGTYHLRLDRLSDSRLVFQLSKDPLRGMRPWPKPTCPLLLGSRSFNGDRRCPTELYQSAILLDSQERIVGRYHKRLLMPFGEYVPGKDWVPGIERLFPLSDVVLPGRQATVLPSGDKLRLGAMLCYEDMYPQAAQSLVRNSANLLVSLINGSSFESPLTLHQHRLLAQLRAVECRRYLVRAASTGETCVISPLGRVEASLALNSPGILTAKVALLDALSWSCQIGDLFPWIGCLLLVNYARCRRPRRSR